MRIGINARHLIEGKLEGIGWYSLEVLSRLVVLRPEDEFFFYYDRKTKPLVSAPNVINTLVTPPARHPFLFKIWYNISLPFYFKKHKIDLFFSPDGFLSLKTATRQIGVIHDLNFEHYPEDLPKRVLKYYKKNMPLFAKQAHKIVTVSEFSKKDISEKYNIDKSKVCVIHNGGNESFKPLNSDERSSLLSKFNNGRAYFIYVGSLHKRKNILRMLKAFKDFNSNQNMDFIIIGEPMWQGQLELDGLVDNVKFLGRKSGEELAKWVAASSGLIYVSYFEGFGLPILEGMMSGVPVVTSEVTSMPEVGGDAVVYVDPFQVSSISEGMKIAVGDFENFRNLGLKQAKKFSWDKSAKQVNDLISKLVI